MALELASYQNGVMFFDFDGCISICEWRDCLLPQNSINKGYGAFHAMLPYDPPNDWIISLMEQVFVDHVKVVVLTCRTEDTREESTKWLTRNCVSYDWMQMRQNDDKRPSPVVKAEYLARFDRSEVKMVFDDRDDVVEHLTSLGYPVFQVEAKL